MNGKRVDDGVEVQGWLRHAGVVKTKPDYEAKVAVRKGYAVYAENKDALAKFERAGVKAAGILDELVQEADLVVDCTPEESGYKPLRSEERRVGKEGRSRWSPYH